MSPRAASADPKNINALLERAWAKRPDAVVISHTRPESPDDWIDITASEALDMVNAVARGLIAKGVKVGERVGIMSRTRYEWTIFDLACWAAGAVPVPIYDTSSADQVDWITSDSEISLVMAENSDLRRTVESVATGQSPVREVLTIDSGALEELANAGAAVSEDDLAKRRASAKSKDLATIIYTSGTTGRPKGVRLTHGNLVHQAINVPGEVAEVLRAPGAQTLLFLTLAHSLARVVEVVCLTECVRLGYTPDVTKLVGNMASFRPSFVLAAPRVFEKIYNSAETKATAGGRGGIFRWAAAQGIAFAEAEDKGKVSPGLALKYRIANALVLSKVKAVFGGNVTHAISGAAPLGARLGYFFRSLGIEVLEGYGLTETTAASHVNRPGKARIGSVGVPLPGLECKLSKDGEVLMRGPMLFDGYHRNPEATKEVLKRGWLHTGDIGTMDADGFLTITGRKKEIIVTAGGKNVAPAVLEDRLRAHPLVSQCVVVGDNKPFIGALITLDTEALPAWLEARQLGEMTPGEAALNTEVKAAIDEAVETANQQVSRAESIRRYRVLDVDWSVMSGHVTPSMKLKRTKVIEDHAADVADIYETP